MTNASQTVSFSHNFGGRASATHLHAVDVLTEGGVPLHTVVNPSEFRVREDGTVTIYSRKFPQTSVYGIPTTHRIFIGTPKKSALDLHTLHF